jgi:hypothetical protein
MVGVADDYVEFLDQHTNDLLNKVNVLWGTARKSINLFMRDMTYNYWIRDELGLEAIEHQLEVPLDSKTMTAISSHRLGEGLDPVRVINLAPEISRKFQTSAAQIADERGIARVHLDLEWWSADSDC